MAGRLADLVAAELKTAAAPFLILPGGRSPAKLIEKLAAINLPWNKIAITTTDERRVAIDDLHSNAGQITEVFAGKGRKITPFWLPRDEAKLNFPATITILGMGLDGHCASLFPGQAWDNPESLLVEARAPNPPHERVSLSMAALLQTQRLILLVPDASKWELCRKILAGQGPDLPLARLFALAGPKLELHIAAPGH